MVFMGRVPFEAYETRVLIGAGRRGITSQGTVVEREAVAGWCSEGRIGSAGGAVRDRGGGYLIYIAHSSCSGFSINSGVKQVPAKHRGVKDFLGERRHHKFASPDHRLSWCLCSCSKP